MGDRSIRLSVLNFERHWTETKAREPEAVRNGCRVRETNNKGRLRKTNTHMVSENTNEAPRPSALVVDLEEVPCQLRCRSEALEARRSEAAMEKIRQVDRNQQLQANRICFDGQESLLARILTCCRSSACLEEAHSVMECTASRSRHTNATAGRESRDILDRRLPVSIPI